jgi:GAF domain-containing protein
MSANPRVQVPLSALEELVRRALDATGAPAGWISFIEDGRERLHARCGVTFTELEAAESFVLSTPLQDPVFIRDAFETRWQKHPLVAAGPRARFVAVVPLVDATAEVIGTLTVIDPLPRNMKRSQGTALLNLASLAMARVEAMRASAQAIAQAQSAVESAPDGAGFERTLSEKLAEHLDGAFFLADAGGDVVRWNAAFAMAIGAAGEARPEREAAPGASPHASMIREGA